MLDHLADYWQTSAETTPQTAASVENHRKVGGLKIRVSLVRFRLRAQSKASHPSWMGGFFIWAIRGIGPSFRGLHATRPLPVRVSCIPQRRSARKSIRMYVPREAKTGDFATAATSTDGKYPIRCYISCYSSYSHRRCSSFQKLHTTDTRTKPHVSFWKPKNRRFCYISYIHRRKTPHSLLHPLLHQLHPPTMQQLGAAHYRRRIARL